MNDINRYITDETTAEARRILSNNRTTGGFTRGVDVTGTVLTAALPHILAQHRADVLKELLSELAATYPYGSENSATDVVTAVTHKSIEACETRSGPYRCYCNGVQDLTTPCPVCGP